MATRIIGVNPADGGTAGSTWGAIGSGLQGVAALVMAAQQAKSANDALKARDNVGLTQRSSFDSTLGGAAPAGAQPQVAAQTATQPPPAKLMDIPMTRTPMSMMPTTSASVDVNATVPPIQLEMPGLVRNLNAGPQMAGGGGAGFQSMFASRFPSLFPQSASQYGGL